MKKPTGKTPITDSITEGLPPAAKPVVAFASWDGGAALCSGHLQNTCLGVAIFLHSPTVKKGGQSYTWGVAEIEVTEDKKTILKTGPYTYYKLRDEAERAAAVLGARMRDEAEKKTALLSKATPRIKRDQAKARLTLLGGQYPGTNKAMIKGSQLINPSPEQKAEVMESILHAFIVDFTRLHKMENLSEHFPSVKFTRKLILDVAKAYRAKLPWRDVAGEYLADGWVSESMNNLGDADLARMIWDKTGVKVTNEGVKKKRYKLDLMTDKKPGPKNRT